MIKKFMCGKDGSESVNWVDGNNRFVGFDFSRQCCEQFGYKYCKFDFDAEAECIETCWSNLGVFEDIDTVDNPDLSNAHFAEVQPFAEYGKFKIEGSPDCNWLILYNYHNGFYYHGFVFEKDGNVVCRGDI